VVIDQVGSKMGFDRFGGQGDRRQANLDGSAEASIKIARVMRQAEPTSAQPA
jgi:hypothetical protein